MPIKEFYLKSVFEGFELSQDQFVDLCILLGCDYVDKIKGIGPKKAIELVSFKSIPSSNLIPNSFCLRLRNIKILRQSLKTLTRLNTLHQKAGCTLRLGGFSLPRT